MVKHMAKAILRTAKLKTLGNIASSLSHNYRTRKTPNADPNRSHENLHDMSTAREVSEGIKSRIPAKHRADAVLAVEYFIGASPEYFKTIDDPKGEKYFALARKWLVERHGAENVISTSVHLDETSPHLIAYVVPLDEKGTLNAKQFLGGKQVLSRMQTDFHLSAGAPCGLERGEIGSKAKHTTVKQYYARVNAVESMTLDSNDIQYPGPVAIDRAKVASYGQKVADALAEQYDELLKNHTTKASIAISELKNELKNTKNWIKILQERNEYYLANNADLRNKNEAYRLTIEQKNNYIASVKEERNSFQEVARLFTTEEINWARDRQAKKNAEIEEAAVKRREREAAAAELIRKENEAKWAAENKAKEDKKAAEDKAKAEAAALVKVENAAREEYRLLLNELWESAEEKMGAFYDQHDLNDMPWTERLALLKSEAEKWEQSAKSDQKAQPTTEEQQEIRNNQRDDYESPSPF